MFIMLNAFNVMRVLFEPRVRGTLKIVPHVLPARAGGSKFISAPQTLSYF